MPPFDGRVGILGESQKVVNGSLQLIRQCGALHAHADMVDNELDAVELGDIVSQSGVLASWINHYRHTVLAGRCQDALVTTLTQDFKVEPGCEAHTQPTGRRSHLSHQIVDFRIVWIEARDVGESPRKTRHRLFGERVFKPGDSVGQFAPYRRPDVDHGRADSYRVHYRERLIDTPLICMNLRVDDFHSACSV